MTLSIIMKLYTALAVLLIVIANAILSHADEDVETLKKLINEQNSLINRFSIKLQQMEAELDRINALGNTIKRQNYVNENLRAEVDELRTDHHAKIPLKQTTAHINGSKHSDERHIDQSMVQTEVRVSKANGEDETDLHRRLLFPDTTTSSPDITPVAFSASLSKNEASLANHHTIVFDNIQTNYGNGYNKHSGAFIVPQTGVYVFTWTLVYELTGQICTHLIVNGIEKANGFAQGSSAPRQTTTSIVVVHVEQGDTVLVRTVDYGGCDQAGSLLSGDKWWKSSFSGWLIR